MTIANFRDIGGHPTHDGRRVRLGLAYRSTDLSRIDEADRAHLDRLGLRTVVDLRTPEEQTRWPEEANIPRTALYIVANVLADAPDGTPAELFPLMNDPRALRERLGRGQGIALFERHYRGFVRLPSARQAYRRLYSTLLDPDRQPLLFHCTTGKDRTGWAAAALLLFLGVPEEIVVEDYLRSNGELGPLVEPFLTEFRARGGDPSLLEPLVGVRRSYLEAALDEVERRFGSMEGYFARGLGLDERGLDDLRAVCLEAHGRPGGPPQPHPEPGQSRAPGVTSSSAIGAPHGT